MSELVINGGRPLTGSIRVNGAKNACLPIMAAALLVDGPIVLGEAPHLTDVETLRTILSALGVNSEWVAGDGTLPFSGTERRALRLETQTEDDCECPADPATELRASVCVLGPLLASRGYVKAPMPGGCVLGPRPIDLHLKGLEALGADIRIEKGFIYAKAKQLKGARIYLGGPRGSTVLGTANVMMAATLAKGATTIEHAACEPEIQDLAHFLNACGANITGVGTATITIEGIGRGKRRRLKGAYHTVIPDRIEAGTLACAAAITGGDLVLEGVRTDHMTAVLDAMTSMGVKFDVEAQPKAAGKGKAPGQAELPPSGAWRAERLHVRRKGRLKPAELAAMPYPGLPTDMQPQLMAVLTLADGTSGITDAVYPERFTQVTELARLGADVSHGSSPGQARVTGPAQLTGATVTARDLRGGASLILAALAAEGETIIEKVFHIDRGYERIDERLAALGADIRRVEGRGPAERPKKEAPREPPPGLNDEEEMPLFRKAS